MIFSHLAIPADSPSKEIHFFIRQKIKQRKPFPLRILRSPAPNSSQSQSNIF
jgi:hypothetical protein